jgi:hypothetical protein
VVIQAEAEGGKYFRLEHSDAQFVLELIKTEKYGLEWRAIYHAVGADTPVVVPVSANVKQSSASDVNSGQ